MQQKRLRASRKVLESIFYRQKTLPGDQVIILFKLHCRFIETPREFFFAKFGVEHISICGPLGWQGLKQIFNKSLLGTWGPTLSLWPSFFREVIEITVPHVALFSITRGQVELLNKDFQ